MSKYYLDANVFVYAMREDEPAESAKARRFLDRVFTDGNDVFTSVLTWDEIVWSFEKLKEKEKGDAAGEKFLHFPQLELLPVTPQIIWGAQQLKHNFKLNPRDAIHAATAILKNIPTIASFDPDFDKIKGLKRVEPK